MSISRLEIASAGHLLGLVALGACAALLAGCSGNLIGNETLAPDRYYHVQPPGTDESRHVLMDKPEAAMYNQVHVDLLNKDSGALKLPGDEDGGQHGESVTELSPESRELVHADPSTQPLPPTSSSATTAVVSSADHAATQPLRASAAPQS